MKLPFLKGYYGGRSLPAVADVIRTLARDGLKACVSALPRFRLRPEGVRAEKDKILGILPFLESEGLSADLTVKLSQLGQRWVFKDCVESLEEITAHCEAHGAFLWVDMEQSGLVDSTIEAFETVARRHANVGICLQTYLRRTAKDLDHLLKSAWPVRLVKGYYRERPPAAFDTWEETTQNFARLILPLVEKSRRPAIGTHDKRLIDEAGRVLAMGRVLKPLEAAPLAPAAEGSTKRSAGDARTPLEFQFFLGAKPELAKATARAGRPARIYIPYGALLPYLLHSLPFMDLSRNLQRVLRFETIR